MAVSKRKLAALSVVMEALESSEDDTDSDYLQSDAALVNLCGVDQVKRKPRHRQKRYVENIVNRFRLDEFKTFFRVSRESVEDLGRWIQHVCLQKGIEGILGRRGSGGSRQKSLDDRMLMMLWYLASKDKYASIADRFGLSESTANIAIRNLLKFINVNLRDIIICWPSHDELQEMQGQYEDLKSFPGVVGMIDGTHIPIRRPTERGIDYYNRKEFYSVVLQAVCREDLRFTDVYCGWPGKVHDARVFKHSPLFEQGRNLCGDGHILGDSSYPNMDWILSPFRDNGHLTPAQRRFNQVHASIRSCNICINATFQALLTLYSRLASCTTSAS